MYNCFMSKNQRTIIGVVQFALVALAVVLLVRGLNGVLDIGQLGGLAASFILPFAPALLDKFFKIRLSFAMQLAYLVFLFASLFLGINLGFYHTVPGYDKLVHLVSGVMTVILAWYTMGLFGVQEHTKKSFQALFMICFSVTVAALWEYFEFACDQLLGQSMQQPSQFGVQDTMFDMLAATVGAGVAAVFVVRKSTK